MTSQSPLVILALVRVILLDMLDMHLAQLVDGLLDVTMPPFSLMSLVE